MDFLKVFLVVLIASVPPAIAVASDTKHYVVYMGSHSPPDMESVVRANHKMLASVNWEGGLKEARDAVLHHYSRSFHGFSAMLTPEQAQRLSGMESVVSVFQSKMSQVHTTHSWDFLHVNSPNPYSQQLIPDSVSDVIVGIIDSLDIKL